MLNNEIEMATEKPSDLVEEEDPQKSYSFQASNSRSNGFGQTPVSALPEMRTHSGALFLSPILFHLPVQAVVKLNPIDIKHLSFNVLTALKQMDKAVEEAKLKKESEDETEVTDARDCGETDGGKMMAGRPNTLITNPDKFTNKEGYDWNGNSTMSPATGPENLATGPVDVLLLPQSL